jgi:hypothetical protein
MVRATVLAASSACLLFACTSPSASVTFATGPQLAMVRSTEFTLPEELRDGDRVREQPCGPMGFCPSADPVDVVCEGGVCDPVATTIEIPVGTVLDFDDLSSELESFFTELESIRVTSATYEIRANTLTVDLAPTRIYWGPEGATSVASPGVALLGTIPALPTGTTGTGDIALDDAGGHALSEYLVHTARRVRFFAETTVDLEPGGRFPAGELTVAVDLAVRAEGKVVD